MKKLIFLMALTATSLYPSISAADGRGWGHHHHGHHHDHGHHHYRHHHSPVHPFPPQINYYYPAPEVRYYPAPPVVPPIAYYPAPPVVYYQQPMGYPGYYDQRSPQGLAGGVIGGVLGYEAANGDPIATGLGAAAGSFLGNGIARRY